ncbi:MAG: bile acid:sodium symporter family protein, partial [Candidatus Hinthialibacter sp.]
KNVLFSNTDFCEVQRLMPIHQYIERQLAPLAILISAAALVWPAGFAWMKPHIPLMLGVIMFGMGTTLKGGDFQRVLYQPKYLIAGVLAQYGIMPLMGFLIGRALGLDPALTAGIVLLGSCPGGTASNVIVYLARANVGLSVSLTLASTLLAPLLTPWLTWLYAHAVVNVDVWDLMRSVVNIVLIPLLGGLIIRAFFHRWIQPLMNYFPTLSALIILAIIGCVVALNRESILGVSALAALAVVLHNAAGLLLGYGAGALLTTDRDIRRTLAIEVGMQNSGLAVALALKTSGFGAMAALPGALFSVWHNITGTTLAGRWSKSADDRSQNPVL